MYLHAVHRTPLTTAYRGLSRTTSKIGVITVEDISKSVHAIILAGGSADNPLARYRAMPAVELGERPALQLELMHIANVVVPQLAFLMILLRWSQFCIDLRCCIVLTMATFCAGSSTQLIDISISNCIRSGVNKLCAFLPPFSAIFWPLLLSTAMPVQRKRALPVAMHTIS